MYIRNPFDHTVDATTLVGELRLLRPLLEEGPFPREPLPHKNNLANPNEQEHDSFQHRALHHARMVVFGSCDNRGAIGANLGA